jgi:hypothetical protein
MGVTATSNISKALENENSTTIGYSPYGNLTTEEIRNLTREKISEAKLQGNYGAGIPFSKDDFFGRESGLGPN